MSSGFSGYNPAVEYVSMTFIYSFYRVYIGGGYSVASMHSISAPDNYPGPGNTVAKASFFG